MHTVRTIGVYGFSLGSFLERLVTGLATLMSYVEGLGGTVEVTATFGSRKVVL